MTPEVSFKQVTSVEVGGNPGCSQEYKCWCCLLQYPVQLQFSTYFELKKGQKCNVSQSAIFV